MATFLELCRRVHRYARIGQDPPGTAPETVQDQDGVLAEIIGWVQDAYVDIQADQDNWTFREVQGTFEAPAGERTVNVHAAIDDYEQLRPFTAIDRCRYVLVNRAGEGAASLQPVFFVPWEDWRGGCYERGGAAEATGQPSLFSVQPDGQLRLYPTPDTDVELTLGYQRALHTLDNDADTPILPDRHHEAIVWRALMIYADTRGKTQEPYQKWERRRRQAMRRLYRDQLPAMSL